MRLKYTMLALLVAAGLTTGCTAAQLQAVENDVHLAVIDVQDVIAAVNSNQAKVDEIDAYIADVLPKTGAVAQAHVDLLKAWEAYKKNKGTLDQVNKYLALIESLTAPKDMTASRDAASRGLRHKKTCCKPK